MNKIYAKALKECLVEREKIDSAVRGLVQKIARLKNEQLDEFITKNQPLKRDGYDYAGCSYELQAYRDDAFYLTATFLLKDVKIPNNPTKKEKQLLEEYSLAIKDAPWGKPYSLKNFIEKVAYIDKDLRYLKHSIKIIETCYFYYNVAETANEDLLNRGFSFKNRDL